MSKSMKNKSKMKFAELAAQWLASMTHGVKESTLAHYRYTLSRYLLPVFGEYQISLLDAQQLEQGLLRVIAPADGSHMPLGASSSRECLTMLRRICKYGAHLQLMKPVEICIKLLQMEQNAPKPLSSKEQAAVQAFVLQHPTARKVGLLLQMQLGLRIGEVCGLQWGDFDLRAGTLTIRRTVSRICCDVGRTKVVIQTPKTKSSGREIPIPQELVVLLRKLRGNARWIPGFSPEIAANRQNPAATARVFGDICGVPLSARFILMCCGIPLPQHVCRPDVISKP